MNLFKPMIPIPFDGGTAYLLDDAPTWTSGARLGVELPTHQEEGLTGRETRRPLGDTPRLSLNYNTLLQGAGLTAFRNSLRDWTTEYVLCPLWVCPFEAGEIPAVTASFYVLLGDGLPPEIKDSAPPFARPGYPLLVGRLAEAPEPVLITDEVAAATIKFVENADWAISLAPYAAPDGLDTPAGVRPILPFRPNWGDSIKSGKAEVQLERREIGEGRASADAFFTQPSRRSIELNFTLTAQETWNFLRLWLDVCGAGQSLWVPAGIADARLTGDVISGATFLTVDNQTGRSAAPAAVTYHVLDDLSTRTPVKVTGNTGPDGWTLASAVGETYTARHTRIESLVLARVTFPRLTIQWPTPFHAQVSLAFIEVPWEVEAVEGETVGTTMGAMPTSAYLYEFSIAYPDGTQVWRFTDFERDLDNGPHHYAHAQIEHTDIAEEDNLDRQQTQIKTRFVAGHPLGLLIPFRLEWPLRLEIREADLDGSTIAAVHPLFVGEVSDATNDGPFINAKAASLGSLYDAKLPRLLYQTTCNWSVYGARCQGGNPAMDRLAWRWTGSAYDFDAATAVVSVSGVSRAVGAAIVIPAHFFAGGYLAIGTGNAVQYRRIADSTAQVGGGVTLTLCDHFGSPPALPAAISFYPGCSGRADICQDRFGNFPRFGGFPFMPPGNPSALKISKNLTSGGKK